MSDNIIIGVHGQAQTLEGINGINAKEATGGSTNYVPEDTLKVGGKTVTQNGTYNAADDNMLGYKRVVVMDLVSEGPSKTFQNTRKHNAMIACGGRQRVFANVKKLRAKNTNDADYTVAPSPNLRTKSLSVLHPGTYDVSSETDADVYTPVYVSVSDIERDAAGFNPSNPTWQDNLPDEIRVTTPPIKTDYSDGEEIDYTGMVVKAYKNGSVWSNEKYSDGIIPFDELILPEKKYENDNTVVLPKDKSIYSDDPAYNYSKYLSYYIAFCYNYNLNREEDKQYVEYEEAQDKYWWIAKNEQVIQNNASCIFEINGEEKIYQITAGTSNGNTSVFLFSKQPISITRKYTKKNSDGTVYTETTTIGYWNKTKNGLSSYISYISLEKPGYAIDEYSSDPSYGNTTYVDVSGLGYTTGFSIAPSLLYGEKGLLIKWTRPVDKKLLQTMLYIEQNEG